MTRTTAVPWAVSGGWRGADLAAEPGRWQLAIPEPVADELMHLASAGAGVDRDPLAPPPAVSDAAGALVEAVRGRLAGYPGFVLLRGFPVSAAEELVQAAYGLFGKLIGPPVSQTRDGTFLARVEDRGANIGSPTQRGHRSASALAFHADRTDVIGLLCVRPAAEGGLSRIVSSKELHNIVLAERPDLLPVLYDCLPNDQRGEEQPGQPAWCPLPVFSQVDGDFAARYVRRFIEGSQRHDDAPRLTRRQREAMDLVDEILDRPAVAFEMDLRPGDLQLINNFHLLHSRSAFRDPDGPHTGRLLLRLWLSFAHSPTLPDEFAALCGETAGGAYRGGVWPPDSTSRKDRAVF